MIVSITNVSCGVGVTIRVTYACMAERQTNDALSAVASKRPRSPLGLINKPVVSMRVKDERTCAEELHHILPV